MDDVENELNDKYCCNNCEWWHGIDEFEVGRKQYVRVQCEAYLGRRDNV